MQWQVYHLCVFMTFNRQQRILAIKLNIRHKINMLEKLTNNSHQVHICHMDTQSPYQQDSLLM